MIFESLLVIPVAQRSADFFFSWNLYERCHHRVSGVQLPELTVQPPVDETPAQPVPEAIDLLRKKSVAPDIAAEETPAAPPEERAIGGPRDVSEVMKLLHYIFSSY